MCLSEAKRGDGKLMADSSLVTKFQRAQTNDVVEKPAAMKLAMGSMVAGQTRLIFASASGYGWIAVDCG